MNKREHTVGDLLEAGHQHPVGGRSTLLVSDISLPDHASETPLIPNSYKEEPKQSLRGWNLNKHFGRAFQVYADNYVLLILTAAMAVSLDASCIKILSEHVSVFQVMSLRAIVGNVFIYGACLWQKHLIVDTPLTVAFGVGRGVIGGASYLCWAFATFMLPLSEAAFMTNSYPVVTAVLSWLIGREQLGVYSWLGVIGCVIGNAVMAHPPFLFGGHEDWGTKRVIGLIVAGCANFLIAATFLYIGFVGKRVPSLVLVFYLHCFMLFYSIPFLIVGYPKPINTRHSALELLGYAGIFFAGVVNKTALTRALQVGPTTKVTALFLINMIMSGLVGVVVLGEGTSWLSIVGSTVVIVSVLTVVLQRSKKEEQQPRGVNDLEHAPLTEQDAQT